MYWSLDGKEKKGKKKVQGSGCRSPSVSQPTRITTIPLSVVKCQDFLQHWCSVSNTKMSRNSLPERAAVTAPSLPAFIPSVIATAMISFALGYWVGVGSSLLPFSGPQRHRRRSSPVPGKEGTSSSSENSSEDETDSLAPIHDSYENSTEECKMARSRVLPSSSNLFGRCSLFEPT